MARGDCNITNICIPTRRIIYSAGFTPPAPPPPGCPFPEGSFSQGGEICDWGYRVRWDIDPAQVPSDQTNYLAYISLTELAGDLNPTDNALFWNDANRAEFRVTTSDGATEIPHYTSAIDNPNETGYIWALVPSVSSSVTTSLFIYLANPVATEYAVGNPLGRNATFAGFAALWDFEQDPAGAGPQLTDLTGNGRNGTMSGTGSAVWEAGKVGRQWRLNGTNQYIGFGQILPMGLNSVTFGGWMAWTLATGARGLMGKTVNNNFAGRYYLLQGGNTFTNAALNYDGTVTRADTGIAYSDGTSRLILSRVDRAQGQKIYINASEIANANRVDTTTNMNNNFLWDIGIFRDGSSNPAFFNDLRISLGHHRYVAAAPDLLSTEHNNQNDPGTFATFTNFLANT